MLTRSSQEERLRQAGEIWDFSLSEADMALISGLAWFVKSPSNQVPASVLDTYGVGARDAVVGQLVEAPHGDPVAEPIKACDMAWNMMRDAGKKVEL